MANDIWYVCCKNLWSLFRKYDANHKIYIGAELLEDENQIPYKLKFSNYDILISTFLLILETLKQKNDPRGYIL